MANVLVIAGGTSTERSISLQSGDAVLIATREAGHVAELWDPAESDQPPASTDWDVAFPVAHGTAGEDGTLQRRLAELKLPWVGSSATASELTFNKIRTCEVLAAADLPVAESSLLPADDESSAVARVIEFGLPAVVKPVSQGSSVGISVVRSAAEVPSAVRKASAYPPMFVERFIEGHEATVALVNGRALPAIHIIPHGWYDYSSKYEDDKTQYKFDSPALPDHLGDIAARACEVCGVTGFARIDFRIDHDRQPWILEVNTSPGMTDHSLVPKAAAKAGQTLAQLCDELIRGPLCRI